MTEKMKVGDREIGTQLEPWIVAEMSANHHGSLDQALKIVEAAADCGAHAVKLQTYTPETMTLDVSRKGFVIEGASLWQGRSLYDLYREAQTPASWHEAIFKRCRELGMIGFSSPFDPTAVDFLEGLDVPCYKIASLEILDHELLKRVAKTQKPIFMSTGAAHLFEIEEAMNVIAQASGGPVTLLKCTSAYPTPYEQANLKTIEHLRAYFGVPIGLSDHTLGTTTAIAAVALGACVIEKHFMLSRDEGGVDSAFSLEPPQLRQLIQDSKIAWQSVGSVTYGVTPGETVSHGLRRSLYISRDVKKDQVIDASCVRAIRPGLGLAPRYWDMIKGRTFNQDVAQATPFNMDFVDRSQWAPFMKLPSEGKPRVVGIVQARMGSTRLPGKVLLPLAGRTMLGWVVDRLRLAHSLDEVVVATTEDTSDDFLFSWCQDQGVLCVRGSTEEVLIRYLKAMEVSQADVIVRITSDCPLVDPDLVDEAVERFLKLSDQCHILTNAVERSYPRGLDVEVFSSQALKDLSERSLTLSELEHVTLGFYQRPESYAIEVIRSPIDLAHYRWTVDTPLDYSYVSRIYETLQDLFESRFQGDKKKNDWTSSVLELLNQEPLWAHLNGLERQKRAY